MVSISKIKKIGRKVNVVALTGAVLIGGMGLMSFVGGKEAVPVKQTDTDVIRGVLDFPTGTPGRIYLTAYNLAEDQGQCNLEDMLCKISVDPNLVVFDATEGRYYINDTDVYDIEATSGPYSE